MGSSFIKYLAYSIILFFSFSAHSIWRKTGCQSVFENVHPNEDITNTRLDREIKTVREIENQINLSSIPKLSHYDIFNDQNVVRRWDAKLSHPSALQTLFPPGVHFLNEQSELSPDPITINLDNENVPYVSVRVKYGEKDHTTTALVPLAAFADNLKHIVENNDLSNRWLVGTSAKAVVLFLHGGGTRTTNGAAFINDFTHLSAFGIDGIALDLPLHGQGSRLINGSLEEEMYAVGEFVKKYIPPNVPLFVYGHSFGGILATQLMQMTSKQDTSFFHPNLKGVIIGSPAVDMHPHTPAHKRLDHLLAHERLARELALKDASPEETRLWESVLKDGKHGHLEEMFTLLVLEQLRQRIPAHKGKEYLPALMMVGLGDPLVYLGRESGFNYFKTLKNVETLFFDSYLHKKYPERGPMKVGHLIGDFYFNEDSKKINIEQNAIKKFISEQLGEELSTENSRRDLKAKLQRELREDIKQDYTSWINFIQLYANNLPFRSWVNSLENFFTTQTDFSHIKKIEETRENIIKTTRNIIIDNLPQNQFASDIKRMAFITENINSTTRNNGGARIWDNLLSSEDLTPEERQARIEKRRAEEEEIKKTLELENITNNLQSYSNHLPKNYSSHINSLLEDQTPEEAQSKAREIALKLFFQEPLKIFLQKKETELKKQTTPGSKILLEEMGSSEKLEKALKLFPYNSQEDYPENPIFSLSSLAQEVILNKYKDFDKKLDPDKKVTQEEVDQILESQHPRVILYKTLLLLAQKTIPTSNLIEGYQPILQEYLQSLSYIKEEPYSKDSESLDKHSIKKLHDLMEDLLNQSDENQMIQKAQYIFDQYSYISPITTKSPEIKELSTMIQTINTENFYEYTNTHLPLAPNDAKEVLALIQKFQNQPIPLSTDNITSNDIVDFIIKKTQIPKKSPEMRELIMTMQIITEKDFYDKYTNTHLPLAPNDAEEAWSLIQKFQNKTNILNLIVKKTQINKIYSIIETLSEVVAQNILKRSYEGLVDFYSSDSTLLNDIKLITENTSPEERSELAYQLILTHFIKWKTDSNKITKILIRDFSKNNFLQTLEQKDYDYLSEENKNTLKELYEQYARMTEFSDTIHIPQLEDYYAHTDSLPQTEDNDKRYLKSIEIIRDTVDELKTAIPELHNLAHQQKVHQTKINELLPDVRHKIRVIKEALEDATLNPPEPLKETYNNIDKKFEKIIEIREDLEILLIYSLLPFLDGTLEITNQNIINTVNGNLQSIVEHVEESYNAQAENLETLGEKHGNDKLSSILEKIKVTFLETIVKEYGDETLGSLIDNPALLKAIVEEYGDETLSSMIANENTKFLKAFTEDYADITTEYRYPQAQLLDTLHSSKVNSLMETDEATALKQFIMEEYSNRTLSSIMEKDKDKFLDTLIEEYGNETLRSITNNYYTQVRFLEALIEEYGDESLPSIIELEIEKNNTQTKILADIVEKYENGTFKSVMEKYDSTLKEWQELNKQVEREFIQIASQGGQVAPEIEKAIIGEKDEEGKIIQKGLYGSLDNSHGTYRELANLISNLAEIENKIIKLSHRIPFLKQTYYHHHPDPSLEGIHAIFVKNILTIDKDATPEEIANHFQKHNRDLKILWDEWGKNMTASIPPLLPVNMTEQ